MDINYNQNKSKSKSIYKDINISRDSKSTDISTPLAPIITPTINSVSNKTDDTSETEDSSETYETNNNYFSTFLEAELQVCNNDVEKVLLKQLCDSFNPIETLIKSSLPTPKQLIRIREHNKYKKELYYTNLAIKKEAKDKFKGPIQNLKKHKDSDEKEKN